MSLAIQSAKVYNAINTSLILEKQAVYSAVKALQPYSIGVLKNVATVVPKGDYFTITVKDGEIKLKNKSYDSLTSTDGGVFIPKFVMDKDFVKTNIGLIKTSLSRSFALCHALDYAKESTDKLLLLVEDDAEVSEMIKSINFESKTVEQVKALSDLTERNLRHDRENVIHSWLKHYPISYCCYGVDL